MHCRVDGAVSQFRVHRVQSTEGAGAREAGRKKRRIICLHTTCHSLNVNAFNALAPCLWRGWGSGTNIDLQTYIASLLSSPRFVKHQGIHPTEKYRETGLHEHHQKILNPINRTLLNRVLIARVSSRNIIEQLAATIRMYLVQGGS